MRELPKANEIWHHFKNKTYPIITIAEHTKYPWAEQTYRFEKVK